MLKETPSGDFIDTIHEKWFGKYDLLEYHHGYIQWLFPIHEEGLNWQAQVLQRHEAKTMRETAAIKERVLKSYKLILDFYGAIVEDEKTGVLRRADHFRERLRNLNQCWHNFLRITRILKFLGEVETSCFILLPALPIS